MICFGRESDLAGSDRGHAYSLCTIPERRDHTDQGLLVELDLASVNDTHRLTFSHERATGATERQPVFRQALAQATRVTPTVVVAKLTLPSRDVHSMAGLNFGTDGTSRADHRGRDWRVEGGRADLSASDAAVLRPDRKQAVGREDQAGRSIRNSQGQ